MSKNMIFKWYSLINDVLEILDKIIYKKRNGVIILYKFKADYFCTN